MTCPQLRSPLRCSAPQKFGGFQLFPKDFAHSTFLPHLIILCKDFICCFTLGITQLFNQVPRNVWLLYLHGSAVSFTLFPVIKHLTASGHWQGNDFFNFHSSFFWSLRFGPCGSAHLHARSPSSGCSHITPISSEPWGDSLDPKLFLISCFCLSQTLSVRLFFNQFNLFHFKLIIFSVSRTGSKHKSP